MMNAWDVSLCLFVTAILLTGMCCPGDARPARVASLYVATSGRDDWSGKLAAPNKAQTDGPFATLERARDEIRAMKRADGLLPQGGVRVQLRGGVYECKKAFELTAEDSGTADWPIVYRAYRSEEVRLIGGKVVTGFKPVTDPGILGRLDESARGHVLQADLRAQGITDFGTAGGGGLEFFFQDRPMMLARWPNDGFTRIVDVVGGQPYDIRGTVGDRVGKFVYEGDRPKRWVGEKDVWMHGYWFWDWSDQRQKVESIDTEKRIISLVPPYHGYGYRKGQWFYAYNVLAEIDTPGEWYLDRETGILYFWPPAPIDQGTAVASILPTLITTNGASYVTFRGLTLEATRATAIAISEGTHVQIARCTLRNLGDGAVSIGGGTDSGVTGCDIYQTGGGGISLSGGDRQTLTPARHYAENNHIHHYSRWYRMYHPAISVGGVGNRIAHNLIHDAPHMGIGFSGNDHVIQLNELHHVCMESNDAGAMYAGRNWTMRGTVIRDNYLHDINGFEGRGCVGVYLDDMWCGTAIESNVFYRVTMAAFVGGGRDNIIRNNVFVDCNPAVHIDARALGWAADTVDTTMKDGLKAVPYQEPPWSERYPLLVNILADDPAAPKGNIVERNICVGGRWDNIEGSARPLTTFKDNLLDQDPRFVDAANLNFQLRDDSPAYKLGFRRIPIDKIGLYKRPQRAPRPG